MKCANITKEDGKPVNKMMNHISKDLIGSAAAFFKVLGDETRMKILCTIADDEVCVNDIAEAVDMTKSAVSHQLKLLKDDDLVKSRREGKNIFYSLDDQHVIDMLDIAFVHITHKTHGAGCSCACCSDAEEAQELR